RSHLIAIIAILVLSAGAVTLMYGKIRKTETAYAQLQTDEENTRVRYGKAIVLGEHEAQLIPSQLKQEQQLSETRGDEAMARIEVIKAGIERTKVRIEELD